MKKIYIFCLLAVLALNNQSNAQCTGGRYTQAVFADFTLTSDIIYGSNFDYNGVSKDLKMDIYEPLGDTVSKRPTIFIAHGGNFLGGSKTGSDVAPLAQDFAKMGYVVVSLDYRVGFEGLFAGTMDSVEATETVVRAVHDFRAAIRFIKKDYSENGNTYGVDTTKIIASGVSAGAITAVHVAYLDEINELPSYIDTTKIGLGGGIEGNSGSPNYVSSGLMGVINISGALRDTSWMTSTSAPLLSLHGDLDDVVPYGTDIIYLLGQYEIMEVDGSYSMDVRADNLGLTNCFFTYYGAGHVPHVGDAAYTDTTENMMTSFLGHLICGDALNCSNEPIAPPANPSGIEEDNLSQISIYPNPSTGEIGINTNNPLSNISLYNLIGELVWSKSSITNKNISINLSHLPKGVYLAKIAAENKEITKKVILE